MVEHPTILKPTIVEKMVNFEKISTIFKVLWLLSISQFSSFSAYFLVLPANTIDDLHDFQ